MPLQDIFDRVLSHVEVELPPSATTQAGVNLLQVRYEETGAVEALLINALVADGWVRQYPDLFSKVWQNRTTFCSVAEVFGTVYVVLVPRFPTRLI